MALPTTGPDLPRRLTRALLAGPPGDTARHELMPVAVDGTAFDRPAPRNDTRDAAVLLLLYPDTGHRDWYLTLIKRPDYDGVHSGQIAFPGGRREGEESLTETALRETREEVGVDPGEVTLLGELTPFFVFASNHMVHPFVGYVSVRPGFVPCEIEVAQILEIPLSHLLEPANLRHETRELRWGPARIPFFAVDDHKVWGATAMVLAEFLELTRRL
ncbi:MAG: CoA pyrophosphatase [Pseudomonadota bacterium]|nr:CoA pyrophosphatase [Pseudomonadota bacterium]